MSLTFDLLRFTGRRPHAAEDEEREAVSLAEAQAAQFSEWASKPEGAEYLKHLDNLIAFAESEEAENIENHALMAKAHGKREALGALRAEFNRWRDSGAL